MNAIRKKYNVFDSLFPFTVITDEISTLIAAPPFAQIINVFFSLI